MGSDAFGAWFTSTISRNSPPGRTTRLISVMVFSGVRNVVQGIKRAHDVKMPVGKRDGVGRCCDVGHFVAIRSHLEICRYERVQTNTFSSHVRPL